MPMFIGPPCNKYWYKTRFDKTLPGGGLTADVVPESVASGCFVEFSEEGLFFLDPKKKHQTERWTDIMKFIIGLPEWGTKILPSPVDDWWKVPHNAKEYGVSFSKGEAAVKMTVQRTLVDGTAVDAVHAVGTAPVEGEMEITAGE